MKEVEMFIRHKRLSEKGREIALIENIAEFIELLLKRKDIPTEYKVFATLALSAGCRTNEVARSLKKEDFQEMDGNLYFKIRVLKKRRDDTRWGRVHPSAVDFIKNYLKSCVGYLVKKSDSALRKQTKKFFAEKSFCQHAYRHSAISYLLFQSPKKMTHIELSKLLHMSVQVVERYAWLDEKSVLKEVF